MDRESDQIGFDELEKMTGFPAHIIKKELLEGKHSNESTVPLSELRVLMANFIDRELLSTQDHSEKEVNL